MSSALPLPKRRSIRLEEYDYTDEGGYFVTIVTHHFQYVLGEIRDGQVHLNEFGRIAQEEWFKTQALRPYVDLLDDEIIVMPNHIHGIIWITNTFGGKGEKDTDIHGTGTARRARTRNLFNLPRDNESLHQGTRRFGVSTPNSLPTIVGAYKSAVTKRINQLGRTPGVSIWHRNYYEHIINTETEYENIVNYVADNPANWGLKEEEDPFPQK